MVIENVFSPTPVTEPAPVPEPPFAGVTAFREVPDPVPVPVPAPVLEPRDVIESWGLSWHLGCALVDMFNGDLASASEHIERERRRLE